MKHTILIAALIVIAAGFVCGQRHTSASKRTDDRAVRHFIDEFSAAFGRNDAAALDRMTLPGYTFVTPTSAVQDREQRVAPIRSGELKYRSAKYDEINVRLYGSTAVVTARVDVDSQTNGKDFHGSFRSTLVLVKMHGHWRLAASQATTIPG